MTPMFADVPRAQRRLRRHVGALILLWSTASGSNGIPRSWNTVPDEYRGHGDQELVDRTLLEDRRDERTTAHQPDVLARLLAKIAQNRADGSLTNSTPNGHRPGAPHGRRRWRRRRSE